MQMMYSPNIVFSN